MFRRVNGGEYRCGNFGFSGGVYGDFKAQEEQKQGEKVEKRTDLNLLRVNYI